MSDNERFIFCILMTVALVILVSALTNSRLVKLEERVSQLEAQK